MFMRTTVELPDALVRELKARAALEGRSMKSLMRTLLEQGLRRSTDSPSPRRQRSALPVVHTGVPFGLEAPTNADLFALLDAQA
jgi:plasmid stability protein